MEELVKLVAQKTGIAEAQAQTAVMTVLGFLKDRLPGPLAGQLDSLLGAGGQPQNPAAGLGSLFDRK
jgi:hypothetical protein